MRARLAHPAATASAALVFIGAAVWLLSETVGTSFVLAGMLAMAVIPVVFLAGAWNLAGLMLRRTGN